MGIVNLPADYNFSVLTLTNVTDNTTYISPSASGGTAETPASGWDSGDGFLWYVVNLKGSYLNCVKIEARTAISSAAISSATYFEIYSGTAIPLANRLRFIQVRLTFTYSGSEYPTVDSIDLTYANDVPNTENSFGKDGLQPTKDGRFKGRRIICGVCGQSLRKPQARKQRGKWVHADTCYDKRLPKKRGG